MSLFKLIPAVVVVFVVVFVIALIIFGAIALVQYVAIMKFSKQQGGRRGKTISELGKLVTILITLLVGAGIFVLVGLLTKKPGINVFQTITMGSVLYHIVFLDKIISETI